MSNLSPFSSMTTMLQTSNIIWQSVNLTDEVKINLEYDIHSGLLNIFVKNIGDNNKLPYHINVLSNRSEEPNSKTEFLTLSEIQPDLTEIISDNEPKICYEISTTYVYDIIDENENPDQIDFSQTMIVSSSSSSSSSSCFFDEQIIDNDDGYSTHSLDDIEQQQQLSLVLPPSKLIIPSFSSSHRYHYYSEQYVSPIRRLIEQLTWLNPFKKTIQQTMMTHIFV